MKIKNENENENGKESDTRRSPRSFHFYFYFHFPFHSHFHFSSTIMSYLRGRSANAPYKFGGGSSLNNTNSNSNNNNQPLYQNAFGGNSNNQPSYQNAFGGNNNNSNNNNNEFGPFSPSHTQPSQPSKSLFPPFGNKPTPHPSVPSATFSNPAPQGFVAPPLVYQVFEKKDLHELVQVIKDTSINLDADTPYLDCPKATCNICDMKFSAENQKDKKSRYHMCVICEDFDICGTCHVRIVHNMGNGKEVSKDAMAAMQKQNHNPSMCMIVPIYTQNQVDTGIKIRQGIRGSPNQ